MAVRRFLPHSIVSTVLNAEISKNKQTKKNLNQSFIVNRPYHQYTIRVQCTQPPYETDKQYISKTDCNEGRFCGLDKYARLSDTFQFQAPPVSNERKIFLRRSSIPAGQVKAVGFFFFFSIAQINTEGKIL